MSFILDALKKAEAERQRQTGPTLLEVRVAQPRRRFPPWMLIIGALLAINIVLLVVFVLRRPAAPGTPPSAPVAAAAPTAPAAAAPVAAAPAASPAPGAAPGSVTPTSAPAVAMAMAAPIVSAASGNAADDADAAERSANPADYQPAVRDAAATRNREPPSLSDIGGNLPELRLDLHVYATRPADRYALINMHRVHEGDVLPEGPRVVAIAQDGVELNYRGTSFMLRPQ